MDRITKPRFVKQFTEETSSQEVELLCYGSFIALIHVLSSETCHVIAVISTCDEKFSKAQKCYFTSFLFFSIPSYGQSSSNVNFRKNQPI